MGCMEWSWRAITRPTLSRTVLDRCAREAGGGAQPLALHARFRDEAVCACRGISGVGRAVTRCTVDVADWLSAEAAPVLPVQAEGYR